MGESFLVCIMKKWWRYLVAFLTVMVVLALVVGIYLWRRALPETEGKVTVSGIQAPAEIVRDQWGIPHIFAENEQDAVFALGWAVAQDRLFHLELLRRLGQGRLAEIFGSEVLPVDKLFRTLGFQRHGQRIHAGASATSRQAMAAYIAGINAYVKQLKGNLPIEFTLLGIDFQPAQPDDFVGVLGFMTHNLNMGWRFDFLYEKLAQKVGAKAARELLPQYLTNEPTVFPATTQLKPDLFRLEGLAAEFAEILPRLNASNNWAVAPSRSTTGGAILANDPHLGHGLPGIWYQAHLKAGKLDVIGVTIPGMPSVVIGHNRDIAWGLTNLMADASDFFLEKLNPENPEQVMYKGQWVAIKTLRETIQVKGEAPVELVIRLTPHGPLVNDLLEGQTEALSYQWVMAEADKPLSDTAIAGGTQAVPANDLDALTELARARNWEDFRTATGKFGAIAQNIAFADRAGHIGLQAVGRIPRLTGTTTGTRYRVGWDGTQEWDGFHPFEKNPSQFDPPEGVVSSANNYTVAESPFYISAYWEPVDRIIRIRERLSEKERFSPNDLKSIQQDIQWLTAREMTPRILAAFDGTSPDPLVVSALAQIKDWRGQMAVDSPAAALFAVFYKALFHEMFADELGAELAEEFRERANVSALMMRAVTDGGLTAWYDRKDTTEVEDERAILRKAFSAGVAELKERLGDDPTSWRWGRLHTLTFIHPLGRVAALAPLFNVGPFPMPGHTNTVNKMEYKDEDFKIYHGPSMRQVTDLANPAKAWGMIPTGQSGIPASPHYDDMAPLWVRGDFIPYLMDRKDIEAEAQGTLRLEPR